MKKCIEVLLLILLCVSNKSYAVPGGDSANSNLQSVREKFNQSREGVSIEVLIEQSKQLNNEQFKTMLAQEKEKQNNIDDDEFSMHHRWRSFNFQYYASIVIFLMVIIIVMTGIVFSGIQFRHTLKKLQIKEKIIDAINKKDQQTPELVDAMKTELQVSKDGIKLNSSVLGVIILVVSIAFFYLYLIYVYPIKYVTPQDAEKITGVSVADTTQSSKVEHQKSETKKHKKNN